jgi:hypothetical protein
MEALLFEFLDLILKDVVAPDLLSLASSAITGGLSTPHTAVVAQANPGVQAQAQAAVAGYMAAH